MATQSGPGMRDQGSMAQGVWGGPQQQGQRPAPAGPQGIREGVDYRQGRAPQGPPQGLQGAPGGPPPVPFQGFAPGGTMPGQFPGAGGLGAPGAPGAPGNTGAPGAGAPRGPVPAGTRDPYGGAPVNPDGSYQRSDGTVDWLPGYGPQMGFGGQTARTGQQPTRPSPGDPDAVTGGQRGTPAYRAAAAAHQQWIQENLDAGRTLADLGLEPVRGGGLSDFMRWGSYQPGGAGGRQAPTPNAPPRPQGPGTGGLLPGTEGGFGGFGGPMSYAGQGFGGGLQNAIMNLLMGGRGY